MKAEGTVNCLFVAFVISDFVVAGRDDLPKSEDRKP